MSLEKRRPASSCFNSAKNFERSIWIKSLANLWYSLNCLDHLENRPEGGKCAELLKIKWTNLGKVMNLQNLQLCKFD